jgi:hypothetical protein
VILLFSAGSARGEAGMSSRLLLSLAPLACRDGLAGMLKLLVGLAKGLEGRSLALLICDGRLTKGLAFSGDSDAFFVGDQLGAALLGDAVGVVARTVAGEAEF